MFEFLNYDFMITALLCGFLLAIIIPLVGVIIVLRHLSMVGDSLSHVSLAGVAAGLLGGINPIVGAVIASIIGALSVEVIRKRIPGYAEVAIAIVTAGGVGLAGILSGFVDNSAGFSSFLFGSIVAISDLEVKLVVGAFLIVTISFILLWRELQLIAFDESLARLSGVSVGAVNFIFTILIALTVAVAVRAVGALIVSGIMVVPVVTALLLEVGYKKTIFFSILFGIISMLSALILSFYFNLNPGGTVVLIAIGILIVVYVIKMAILRLQ